MTALTTNRATPERINRDFVAPVAANVRIFAGAMVGMVAGVASPGAVNLSQKIVGVCQADTNNVGGAASAMNVPYRRGLFKMANSAAGDLIALADVGNTCYVVDDNTVAKTNATATRQAAGTIRDVDASDGGVWVEF